MVPHSQRCLRGPTPRAGRRENVDLSENARGGVYRTKETEPHWPNVDEKTAYAFEMYSTAACPNVFKKAPSILSPNGGHREDTKGSPNHIRRGSGLRTSSEKHEEYSGKRVVAAGSDFVYLMGTGMVVSTENVVTAEEIHEESKAVVRAMVGAEGNVGRVGDLVGHHGVGV